MISSTKPLLINKITFLWIFLFIMSNAIAAQNSGQNTSGVVQRIYLSDNTYYFRLQGVDTCARNTGGLNEYYIFQNSIPMAKQYYALLLTAAITKKPVTIRVRTNCSEVGSKEVQYIYQDF